MVNNGNTVDTFGFITPEIGIVSSADRLLDDGKAEPSGHDRAPGKGAGRCGPAQPGAVSAEGYLTQGDAVPAPDTRHIAQAMDCRA